MCQRGKKVVSVSSGKTTSSAPLAAAIAAKRVRALTPALLVGEKLLRDCEPALAGSITLA